MYFLFVPFKNAFQSAKCVPLKSFSLVASKFLRVAVRDAFALHSRNEACLAKFDFGGKFTSLKKSYVGKADSEIVPTEFTLRPNESVMLVPTNEAVEAKTEYEEIIPEAKYAVLDSEDNALLLDCVKYSADGVNYSDTMYFSLLFNELLEKRYEGDLYLKYNFCVDVVPEKLTFKFDMLNVKAISVNGNELEFTDNGNFNSDNIAKFVKLGDNEIVIKLNYWQREHVYYVLFGDNITEGLKNCLAFDAEIEPLVLKGDFAVYSKSGFKAGNAYNVKLGEDFVIGKKQSELTSLVEGGYPFFGGKIALKQSFNATKENVMLKLPFRWHAVKVYVNGKDLGLMMFDDVLDISSATVIGENELVLELVVSGRNLLGPHHYMESEEPIIVPPPVFDISNAKDYRAAYSFVETLL